MAEEGEKSQFIKFGNFGPHGFGFNFSIDPDVFLFYIGFFSVWGLTFFIWCEFVSYCVFILVWGLTVVDFSYSLLWSVPVLPRRRVDIPLCYQDAALLRGTGFTVSGEDRRHPAENGRAGRSTGKTTSNPT